MRVTVATVLLALAPLVVASTGMAATLDTDRAAPQYDCGGGAVKVCHDYRACPSDSLLPAGPWVKAWVDVEGPLGLLGSDSAVGVDSCKVQGSSDGSCLVVGPVVESLAVVHVDSMAWACTPS